jgi:hypothetical protein
MSQIALPFDPATLSAAEAAGFDATGFEIGWDYAHHRLTPPADHLHGTHPVRQGWEAGRAAFGARTLKPSRHVRQWLELRLRAWLRGQAFEGVMVTPRFLAQIDVAQCPVTRDRLTHGADAPTDAVVVRVHVGAGFAAGNLAVLSRRAANARGGCSAAEAQAVARRMGAGEQAAVAGLDGPQWERLAALLRIATPLPHAQVACLPLALLPPNRLRLLNPVQALQSLLTLLFTGGADPAASRRTSGTGTPQTGGGYARRMADLGTLMPTPDARRCYFLFMNTMLARRLAVGWSADRSGLRVTMEDAWTHPVVMRRWEQLALRLTRADCERVVRLAAQRGLGAAGWRWIDDTAATEGWALESAGRAIPSDLPHGLARTRGDVGDPTSLPRRPGWPAPGVALPPATA